MDPIDISGLFDIIGTSDISVIRPVIEVWLESSRPGIEAVSMALKARNRTLLRQAVHKTKGTALQIGAKRLAEICAQTEDEISAADWDIIAGLVREIVDENKRAGRFAEKFFNIKTP